MLAELKTLFVLAGKNFCPIATEFPVSKGYNTHPEKVLPKNLP
jgi:hypothetical protein